MTPAADQPQAGQPQALARDCPEEDAEEEQLDQTHDDDGRVGAVCIEMTPVKQEAGSSR